MNIVSDGMGSWSYGFMEPFLQRTFPKTVITYDNTKPADLVIRSVAPLLESCKPYTCPYILYSGESSSAIRLDSHDPLFSIDTFHSDSVYFPHLFAEIRKTARPLPNKPKRYCCSYAFSNPVRERENLFLAMKDIEPTCYSFGPSCRAYDLPFRAPRKIRGNNAEFFSEFAFNVAMENAIVPGYMTEKIGFAFCSGSVPIYWGDTDTVSDFFNPASFFNVRDYKTPIAAAETAVQIWRDPQKLQKFLDAPITLNNHLTDYEAIYTEYRPWQKLMVDSLRDAFPDLS